MDKRQKLLQKVAELAEVAVFGSLDDNYRRCGSPSCKCHHGGPKHGPFLHVTYRGSSGKTEGYHVLKDAEDDIRAGVAAWRELQTKLKELAQMNKERAFSKARNG